MAKAELGTKRVDPETGKKFYDLNKDPIISPYTGKSYPLSYFEQALSSLNDEIDEDNDDDLGAVLESRDYLSLRDNEMDDNDAEDIPDLGDDEVDIGETEDDPFLTDDDDDDDGVKDIIGESYREEDE